MQNITRRGWKTNGFLSWGSYLVSVQCGTPMQCPPDPCTPVSFQFIPNCILRYLTTCKMSTWITSIGQLSPLRITGLHMKLGAGIVCATGAYYFKQYRNGYLADKDAMNRHYIHLHPEFFKAPGLYIDPTDFRWYSLQVNRVFGISITFHVFYSPCFERFFLVNNNYIFLLY